jgi:hypothetical protein
LNEEDAQLERHDAETRMRIGDPMSDVAIASTNTQLDRERTVVSESQAAGDGASERERAYMVTTESAPSAKTDAADIEKRTEPEEHGDVGKHADPEKQAELEMHADDTSSGVGSSCESLPAAVSAQPPDAQP